MDFATIAGTIATLIFTEAVKKQGEALGQTVSNKITQMVTAIREKFKAVGREGVMTDAEEDPTEENQSEFKRVLEKQMTKDEAFAKKLEEFVKQLESAGVISSDRPAPAQQTNTVTGDNFSGIISQYARDITQNK
jgi:hypothetical protein